MPKQLYHNTSRLARLILRRDRIHIPIWLIAIAFITIITAPAFTNLYTTDQDRQAIAGAMMAHQMLLFTAML